MIATKNICFTENIFNLINKLDCINFLIFFPFNVSSRYIYSSSRKTVQFLKKSHFLSELKKTFNINIHPYTQTYTYLWLNPEKKTVSWSICINRDFAKCGKNVFKTHFKYSFPDTRWNIEYIESKSRVVHGLTMCCERKSSNNIGFELRNWVF